MTKAAAKPPCTFCGAPSKRFGSPEGRDDVTIYACRDGDCAKQFRLVIGGGLAADHGGRSTTKRRTRQDSKGTR